MLRRRTYRAFTLVELLVVVVILAVLIAVLLPALSKARKSTLSRLQSIDQKWGYGEQMAEFNKAQAAPGVPVQPRPRARVKSFSADITLTPKLSVGTAEPQSIYEARFTADILAIQPAGDGDECEIYLPLPPQIISLADLEVTAAGEPTDNVAFRDGVLVWRGKLPKSAGTPLKVTYSAVGKGLYALQVPPGGIVDLFKIQLKANGSDVRMLELSMQPTTVSRVSGATLYTWDYKNLMFGQPISLDVLGIAPIDRLGELSWLGPISVVLFGLIIGLVANAYHVTSFDRWMLLLVMGTFTGAYPLMYFAQEFISLTNAMVIAGSLVLLIIAIRAIFTMGPGLALAGVVFPAAVIMTITLIAAIQPQLQGILLTTEALGFFIAAMTLSPNLHLLRSKAKISPPSLPTPAA